MWQRAPGNFNPRTPCGVRPELEQEETMTGKISIHAPRVGCDGLYSFALIFSSDFNPRTPCGVRQPRASSAMSPPPFQSTHPVWGATTDHRVPSRPPQNFNPRTPCGVRPKPPAHAVGIFTFQSTHPVWGATYAKEGGFVGTEISIHAPRVGCDERPGVGPPVVWHFNPRTPCGVRPLVLPDDGRQIEFQSTHPVWGATLPDFQSCRKYCYFNPRTPCGVRQLLWGYGA